MGSKRHSDGEEDVYVPSRGSSQEDARLIQSENEPPAPTSRPGFGLRRLGPTFLLSLSNLVSLSALLLLLVTRDNSVRPCVPDKHPHWIAPESELSNRLGAAGGIVDRLCFVC